MTQLPHLPRHAELWLPGLIRDRVARRRAAPGSGEIVWLVIADHYEPKWGKADLDTALKRVEAWERAWPEIAARHTDSFGRSAQYTFFYPQEEYDPALLDPLARITDSGFGDVEVHIHHDGDTAQQFVDKMSIFIEALRVNHGLLREHNGKTTFGFIHGNWALDNARPDGRWCGLNNELTLLSDLGCYADFTLPAAPDPCQTRQVNSIYWAIDDPDQARSHDLGPAVVPGVAAPDNSLLMVQGPLGILWPGKISQRPKLEVGELAGNNPITVDRVNCWLDHAPVVGRHRFVKIHGHGAPEKNAGPLLGGELDTLFTHIRQQCDRRGWKLAFATAWDANRAIRRLVEGNDPQPEPVSAC